MDLRARFDVVETPVEVAGRRWTLLHPRSAEALISEPDFERDERLPYWADLWPSSRVLADVLARHHGNGRRALELGCGSGLVACALASAGYAVTATDYYDDALAFTAENVRRTCGVEVDTMHLDWRALPDELPTWDLVVGADVLYERPYGEIVAQVLDRTVAPGGAAIIADPGRIALEPFMEAARARGLALDEGWEVPWAQDSQRHQVRVRVLVRR